MTIKDTWCVWNECERDPIDNQCWEGNDCPECWDGVNDETGCMFGTNQMPSTSYLFDILRDAIGEWPTFHRIRHDSEDMEHCPCCDIHVPDIHCVANVNDLVEDPENVWHLPDGVAVVEENGFGGLMVLICNDCVTSAKGHLATF